MTPEEQIDVIVKNIGLKAVNQFWVTFDHGESSWVT